MVLVGSYTSLSVWDVLCFHWVTKFHFWYFVHDAAWRGLKLWRPWLQRRKRQVPDVPACHRRGARKQRQVLALQHQTHQRHPEAKEGRLLRGWGKYLQFASVLVNNWTLSSLCLYVHVCPFSASQWSAHMWKPDSGGRWGMRHRSQRLRSVLLQR